MFNILFSVCSKCLHAIYTEPLRAILTPPERRVECTYRTRRKENALQKLTLKFKFLEVTCLLTCEVNLLQEKNTLF